MNHLKKVHTIGRQMSGPSVRFPNEFRCYVTELMKTIFDILYPPEQLLLHMPKWSRSSELFIHFSPPHLLVFVWLPCERKWRKRFCI